MPFISKIMFLNQSFDSFSFVYLLCFLLNFLLLFFLVLACFGFFTFIFRWSFIDFFFNLNFNFFVNIFDLFSNGSNIQGNIEIDIFDISNVNWTHNKIDD